MNFFKRQINLILLLITLILTLYNMTSWQSAFLGWILFFLYLVLVGGWWQDILHRAFGIIKKTGLMRILAWFTVFSLLGLLASVDIVFYKLTSLLLWFVYVEVAVSTFFIRVWFEKKRVRSKEIKEISENKNLIVFSNSIFLLLGYIGFWIVGLILLFKSGGTGEILSPWQTIGYYYLPVFFVLTILSGVLLFSKYKTKVLLFIFVLQSLLSQFIIIFDILSLPAKMILSTENFFNPTIFFHWL